MNFRMIFVKELKSEKQKKKLLVIPKKNSKEMLNLNPMNS